jgi:glycosyltransferase involved in cell wall biosynthesis
MKRILYIHHGGTLGGAPLSLLFLLKQLDRTHYEPHVLMTREGAAVELYRQARIPVTIAPDLSDFSHTELVWYGNALLWQLPSHLAQFLPSIRATRRYLAHFQPDLVHLNTSALAASAIACRQAGVPTVWHIREPLAKGYAGIRRRWLQKQVAQAQRVIAISQFDASRLLPSPNVRVVYNFVDFQQFDYRLPQLPARDRLGLNPSQQVVVMLGGANRPKGTLPFVQALPLLKERVPNLKVLVLGPKPSVGASQPLSAWARRLSGVDRYDWQVLQASRQPLDKGYLRYLGVRSDIPQILAAADVLAFPAIVPHFARPVIEAAAMGKPSVASDLGGPQELIRQGETGLLIPPSDPPALANALAEILLNPTYADQLGTAALAFARQHFDAQKNAQQVMQVYAELLG